MVDPASLTLTIDDQAVTPVTNVKTNEITEFTYVPSPPFPLGSTHSYRIALNDQAGNTVTKAGASPSITRLPVYNILARTCWRTHGGSAGVRRWRIPNGQVALSNLLPRFARI